MEANNSWFVIINPYSGNKAFKRKKQLILDGLKQLNSDYSIHYTEYSKHETLLVEQAIEQGYRKFISVGGDGTLHHVVNGVMIHGNSCLKDIKIGVIPVGTGNDWAKNYSIPKKFSESIQILNAEYAVQQDIGQIIHEDKHYYFNNLAGLGFDGFIVKQISSFKKFGKLAYFLASIKGLLLFKRPVITYSWGDNTVTSESYIVAIGICEYCGGGMKLTHESNPEDGLFDVTVVKDISKLGFIWNIRKMFNGKLHKHPKVEIFKTNHISISSRGVVSPLIQADGELIGEGNLEVELIPKAVNFIVPNE